MDALAARLRDRAADAERRVDTPRTGFDNRDGTAAASLGSMLASVIGDLGNIMRAAHDGAVEPGMRDRLDQIGAQMTARPPIPALPAPATTADVDGAEALLGRALPPELRSVYLLVADGGFGPGGGLMSLAAAVRAWQALRRESPGPRGSRWPERLLPVVDDEGGGGYDCVALDTGEVIAWDADGLTEFGRVAWDRSFTSVAPSVGVWLERWVGAPTLQERQAASLQATMIAEARRSRAAIAAMTPEQRAAMGLPAVGWERVVWDGLGLDDEGP